MKDAEGHLSATCQPGPVVTVKSGSVSIPIYLQKTHTGPVYLWSWRNGGKRFRASSKNLGTAKRKARAQAEALARDGGDGAVALAEDVASDEHADAISATAVSRLGRTRDEAVRRMSAPDVGEGRSRHPTRARGRWSARRR